MDRSTELKRIYFADEASAEFAEDVINKTSEFKGRTVRWCKPQKDERGNWFIVVSKEKRPLIQGLSYSEKPIKVLDALSYDDWIKRIDFVSDFMKIDSGKKGGIKNFFKRNRDVINNWIANGGEDLALAINDSEDEYWLSKKPKQKSRKEKALEKIKSIS